MNEKDISRFLLLAALFVAGLVTANLVASKIVNLWGVFVPAGVLAYSLTFAVTDTVAEVWGEAKARMLVRSGFLVLLAVWLLVALAVALPAAPFWQNQGAYSSVFDSATRITLASLVAYILSQSADVWIFAKLKKASSEKHLWLRNNASTFLSQTLDTVIFVTIAFYGVFPIMPVIAGQLLVKYIIALVDTPVVYALVYLVRSEKPGPTTA